MAASQSPVHTSALHTVSTISRWLLLLPLGLVFQCADAAPGPSVPPVAPSGVRTSAQRADLGLGEIATYRKPTQEQALRASALAHYVSALQLESAGKMREAMQHYLDAVKADPSHPQLTAHAAELALVYAGREKALEILEDCLKSSPNSAAAYINVAQFYSTYATDDPFEKDKAVAILDKALTKFPGDAEVYRAAVMTYLTRNQRSNAEKALEQALRQPSQDPDFWLITGRSAQEVWPLAHPEHKVIHRAKVNPFFERALKAVSAEQRPDVHLDVAQYYLLSAQIDRSSQIVEALHRKTGHSGAAKLLVRIYQAQDRDTDAIKLLEDIIQKDPEDVEQRRLAAGIYEQQEKYSLAVPHMEAIIRVAGGSVQDYRALADLLLRSGEAEKALALTQRTRVLFPSDPVFVIVSAIASRALRRPEEAVTYYGKAEALALATAPEMLNDGFYSAWGDLLQSVKRYDEAAKKYQKAIALTPQDNPKRAASVLNNLGYMWLELNQNLDKAGEFIKRACDFDPESYIYLDSLGWYHFLKGEYAEALKVLKQAEGMIKKPDQGDAEILDHIAQTLLKLGDKPNAISYFEKAVSLDKTNDAIRRRLDEAKAK